MIWCPAPARSYPPPAILLFCTWHALFWEWHACPALFCLLMPPLPLPPALPAWIAYMVLPALCPTCSVPLPHLPYLSIYLEGVMEGTPFIYLLPSADIPLCPRFFSHLPPNIACSTLMPPHATHLLHLMPTFIDWKEGGGREVGNSFILSWCGTVDLYYTTAIPMPST